MYMPPGVRAFPPFEESPIDLAECSPFVQNNPTELRIVGTPGTFRAQFG